jgi:hypothetical protein
LIVSSWRKDKGYWGNKVLQALNESSLCLD